MTLFDKYVPPGAYDKSASGTFIQRPTQIKIAFAGQMRSGKDTCGDYVRQKWGGVRKSFAAPIYDILAYAQKRCRIPQSKDRGFLQYIGTNWARETIDQNIWVNILVEEVRDLGPNVNVVVTDARFVNEFDTLKKEGFLLVRVNRLEELRNAAEAGGITQSAATHASELDVLTYEGFDVDIYNNGTLDQLYQTVDQVIADHFNTLTLEQDTPMARIAQAEDTAFLKMLRELPPRTLPQSAREAEDFEFRKLIEKTHSPAEVEQAMNRRLRETIAYLEKTEPDATRIAQRLAGLT